MRVCIEVAAVLVLQTSLAICQQRIEQASLHGTLRDSAGTPVAKADLRLQRQSEDRVRTSTTDDRGEYKFLDLPPGAYELRASTASYRETGISSIFLNPGESKAVDLVLEASTPPSQAAPAFYDEPQFTVSGVTDTTSLGGHGADTVVHARDSLAKDTAALSKPMEAASALKPDDRGRAYELALAAFEAGNLERARTLASAIKDGEARVHHLLGDVQEKLGNPLDAVREFQRAAEMDPSEPYLFDWGAELLLHHAPEPASEVFSKGNRLFPKSVRMLIGLGASLFARGSYDQAVIAICQASDLDLDNPIPYVFLGKIDRADATLSAVIPDRLRRFATQHPESAQANYDYATALWKRRKAALGGSGPEQAEALLNAAIRLDQKFGAAYLQLGILHAEQRDFTKAIADYQRAIQCDPQMEEAHYRLAQAYRQAGEAEKAKAEIDTYEKITKEIERQNQRERHEIQQFVYTLRGPS